MSILNNRQVTMGRSRLNTYSRNTPQELYVEIPAGILSCENFGDARRPVLLLKFENTGMVHGVVWQSVYIAYSLVPIEILVS